MPRALVLALLLMPLPAAAIGPLDDPPPPTPTSDCPDGQVWNDSTDRCEPAQSSRHGDRALILAVRELAYAGRADSAALVLAALADPLDDAALTYRGFVARLQGDDEGAAAWYRAALHRNPGNLWARSYWGQGLAAAGDRAGAAAQLAEIRARGGAGTRAEAALVEALATGRLSRF